MKMKLTALMSGMILSSSALCFSATAADKMVIAHRGASGICRNIPCRRKRWLTLRGRITLSKTS